MDRQFYLGLAESGLRMPIGTHLVHHEHADPEAIVRDGQRLGKVVEEAALRFHCPLGLPLMNLKLEKEALLLARGVAPTQVDAYRFSELPAEDGPFEMTANMNAVCDATPAVTHIGPAATHTKQWMRLTGHCMGGATKSLTLI